MPKMINCVRRADSINLCPCQLTILKKNNYDITECGDIENIDCLILNKPRIEEFGEGTILAHKAEYNAYVEAKKATILPYEKWYDHTYG